MQTRGKLSERSPAELLEWLHEEKKTGVLRFFKTAGSVRKDVFIENGEVVSSATSEPREFLGSVLIASGKISEKDFVQAYKQQIQTKVLFGKVVTMIGKVTEKEVEHALLGKTEETIWDVFLWPEGVFEFDDSARLPQARLPLKVDMKTLVAEGEKRLIEWSVVRRTFPHLEIEVEVVDAGKDLSPLEQRLLGEIASHKPLAQVAIESRLSTFLFLRKMFELEKRRYVRILEVRQEPQSEPDELSPDAIGPLGDPGKAPAAPVPPSTPLPASYAVGKETMTPAELKERIPVVRVMQHELMKMKFDPEEGYLLSRLDGILDIGTVVSLCPFQEGIALGKLVALASRGVLTLQKG